MIKDVGNATELFDLVPSRHERTQVRGGFSSPETFVRYVTSRKNEQWCDVGFTDTGSKNDPAWFGATYAAAEKLCLEGWHDGAARVAKLRDKIAAKHPTGPRVIRWDVAGAVVSVPRALAGNPMNMRRIDSSRLRRRPVITLVSHYGAIANFEPDSFVNRAAVAAAIVDQIEAAGFSCHVVAFTVSRGNGTSVSTAVTIKEPQSPVDVARMAFALGHPAMLRRFTFAFRGTNETAKPLGIGMGSTDNELETDTTANVFCLPSVMNNPSAFETEPAAETAGVAFMLDSLRRQGCPAFPAE